MEFTTKIKTTDVLGYNLDNNEHDIIADLTVVWWLEFDARGEGIKSIDWGVKSVKGELEIHWWGEEEDTIETVDFDGEGFSLSIDMELKSQIYLHDAEIDFKNKTVIFS